MDNVTIFVSVLVVFSVLALLKAYYDMRKQMKMRIERIVTQRRGMAAKRTTQDVSLRRKTTEEKGLVYWLTKPLPDFKQLANRLERAGATMTAKQYVFRRAMWVLGIMFLTKSILGQPWWIAAAIGLVVGVWIPYKFLNMKIAKQNKAFLQLFPDAIDLIVRGLRSGLPVSESMIVVSQEIPDPVGSVFSNISNSMKLGVSLEKGLQEMARKLDMTEFNFFTTCIVLQRETGGNLAEILNNLSEVLRSRYIMRIKIKAMSSEARASAIIIGILPFFVFAVVSFLSPEYMSPLFNDPTGNLCLGIAGGMLGFGVWVMRRMTQFEI
jgi:tight adherence protein B